MTPPKPGAYRFRKESLAEVRRRIGLSQAAMAVRLGVPPNTLSRWETGATTPDAVSLAAVYSIAKEEGMEPRFFTTPDTVLVYFDVPDNSRMVYVVTGPNYVREHVAKVDDWLRNEVKRRVPDAARMLWKAFVSDDAHRWTDPLMDLDYRIWTDDYGKDRKEVIHQQMLADAGQNPSHTTIFLFSAGGDYRFVIEDLQGRGIEVYAMAPSSFVWGISQAVRPNHYIEIPLELGLPSSF